MTLKRLRWSRGSVLTFGTQVHGFTPGRSRRIFRAEKILSTPSFGGEVKPSVSCRNFTACKTTEVIILAKILDISRPQFHLPPLGALAWWHAWIRLVAKVGTSNQDRTISLKAAVRSCTNNLHCTTSQRMPKLQLFFTNYQVCNVQLDQNTLTECTLTPYITQSILLSQYWSRQDRHHCCSILTDDATHPKLLSPPQPCI